MSTVDCTLAHPTMKGVVVSNSGTLRVRHKWSWTFEPGLVQDHTKDPVNGSLKQSEASVNSLDLNGVPRETRLRLLLEVVLPQF